MIDFDNIINVVLKYKDQLNSLAVIKTLTEDDAEEPIQPYIIINGFRSKSIDIPSLYRRLSIYFYPDDQGLYFNCNLDEIEDPDILNDAMNILRDLGIDPNNITETSIPEQRLKFLDKYLQYLIEYQMKGDV